MLFVAMDFMRFVGLGRIFDAPSNCGRAVYGIAAQAGIGKLSACTTGVSTGNIDGFRHEETRIARRAQFPFAPIYGECAVEWDEHVITLALGVLALVMGDQKRPYTFLYRLYRFRLLD